MSDFNYDVEATTTYTFDSATLDGKSEQDGTPTSTVPKPVETINSATLKASNIEIPINLNNNAVASLPDNTKDELQIDETGNVTLIQKVAYVEIDGTDVKATDMRSPTGTATAYRFVIPLPNAIQITSSERRNFLCNIASYNSNAVSTADKQVDGQASLYQYSGTPSLLICIDNLTSTADANDWFASNKPIICYKLANAQAVDLGTIDLTPLSNIDSAIPISFVTPIESTSSYSYTPKTTYEVLNGYENEDAPTIAFPPNHFGQTWETFDANDWNKSEMLDYTGQDESHAVYTVELCELMESGAFDWSRPELDWKEAAYDEEQYERFCKYFEARFMFREIGMLPPLQWFTAFKRMMVYELMPKYKPLYAQVASGLAPLGENEYYKERHVSSAYPETLLSGNSDYISSGEDKEWERVKVDNAADALEAYRNGFRSVDAALGDELEVLFISMYTSYVNGL